MDTRTLELLRSDVEALLHVVRLQLEHGRLQDASALLKSQTDLYFAHRAGAITELEFTAADEEIGALMIRSPVVVRADVERASRARDTRWGEARGLYGLELGGLDLSAFDFSRADLRSTTWEGASITGASLGYADLRGADLTGVVWDEATVWRRARIDARTRLPFDADIASRKGILAPELEPDGNPAVRVVRQRPRRQTQIGATGQDVVVQTAGEARTFERTGRATRRLAYEGSFPRGALDPASMVGQRILDIGTGEGRFVRELRESGVQAYGLDIFLTPVQRQQPYFWEADARRIPCADAFFDGAFTAFSVFSDHYGSAFRDSELEAFLREAIRVLKPGGFLRIAKDEFRLRAIAAKIPEIDFHQDPWIQASPPILGGLEIIKKK